MTYSDILQTVVENGRINIENGVVDLNSLEAEIEFEARERGLNDEQIAEAIAYAFDHISK